MLERGENFLCVESCFHILFFQDVCLLISGVFVVSFIVLYCDMRRREVMKIQWGTNWAEIPSCAACQGGISKVVFSFSYYIIFMTETLYLILICYIVFLSIRKGQKWPAMKLNNAGCEWLSGLGI